MLELDCSHANIGLLYGLYAAYVSSRGHKKCAQALKYLVSCVMDSV